MSTKAKAWAIELELPAITKMVLITLAEHHNRETGQCNPSFKTIRAMAGVARRTAIEHIYKLRDMGLLTIQGKERDNKSRTSNWYGLAIGAQPYAATAQAYAPDAPLEPVTEPVNEPLTSSSEDSEVVINPIPEFFKLLEQERGHQSGNHGGEGRAVKWMFGNGYTSDDILECYRWKLKSDKDGFWKDKTLTMMTIQAAIPGWVQRQQTQKQASAKSNRRVEERLAELREQYPGRGE